MPELDPNRMLLIEEELVEPKGLAPTVKAFGIPARRIVEGLGRKAVLNMVMTGFFAAVTGLVSKDAGRKAIETSVPKGRRV